LRGLSRLVAVGILRAWEGLAFQGSGSVPRPSGPPEAHSPGTNSDRVLIIGGGPASGWGVSSHDLALPGSLARALSARTGRGTDVTLIADPFGFLEQLPILLVGQDLGRMDAIVVFVGVNDAVRLTSEKSWEKNLGRLLRTLEHETLDSTYVYVVDIQPIRTIPVFDTLLGSIANVHARHLSAQTVRVCRSVPRVVFLSLTDAKFLVTGRYRNSTDYRLWGEFLAGAMAERLDVAENEFSSHSFRATPSESTPGLVDIGDRPAKRETRFDRILALTQQSFGTTSAACVLRDHDVMRMTVTGAVAPDDMSWDDSMSASVILQPGATIVGDTHADERFRNKPYVLGPPYMRFYAGFPLESPSGERIGTLCVFDPEPRKRTGVDSVLLRQLALMIQEELHTSGAISDSRD
jgi:hypothetical protein